MIVRAYCGDEVVELVALESVGKLRLVAYHTVLLTEDRGFDQLIGIIVIKERYVLIREVNETGSRWSSRVRSSSQEQDHFRPL